MEGAEFGNEGGLTALLLGTIGCGRLNCSSTWSIAARLTSIVRVMLYHDIYDSRISANSTMIIHDP